MRRVLQDTQKTIYSWTYSHKTENWNPNLNDDTENRDEQMSAHKRCYRERRWDQYAQTHTTKTNNQRSTWIIIISRQSQNESTELNIDQINSSTQWCAFKYSLHLLRFAFDSGIFRIFLISFHFLGFVFILCLFFVCYIVCTSTYSLRRDFRNDD